jgi:ArsR family transcriptional regulator, arsenate/arsenite/antimonite-responsive transcriptional repressor
MDHAQIQKISKALADETRLRIFEAISAKKEVSCGDLVSMRGVTPATVSHHLKVLQEAGLIESRREGLFVYSSSMPRVIQQYTRALARMLKPKSAKRKTRVG